MTDSEIKRRYERMSRTYDRVQVLADLNNCTKRDIEEILGFKSTRKSKMLFDEVDRHDIVRLYESGMSQKRIAQWYNCNFVTIKSVLIQEGVRVRERGAS